MAENERENKKSSDDIAIELLRAKVEENVKVDINEVQSDAETQFIIKNANNKFLLDVLSPEIKKNEEKKRKHKDWLMIAMGIFLLLQFVIVAIMVSYSGYWIVHSHITKNSFPDSTIKLIFTFIGTYITSVVIELIAILKYIVKNVFDTSIAGMVDNFRDNKENSTKEKKDK